MAILGADGRDSGHTVFEPAAAGPVPPAPADQLLPHGFIQRSIADMREVARLFRGANIEHAAQLLEQAAITATEVGSLLQRAGL